MSSPLSYVKVVASEGYMRLFGNRGPFRFLSNQTAKLFPAALGDELCSDLVSVIDETINDPNNGRIWQDELNSDVRILQFEKDIPDHIDQFGIEDHIANIDAFLGSTTRSWMLMANRLTPRPGNLGSGGGFHRDSPFSHQVKCIWYLSDVGPENGPFGYVDGTDKNLVGQNRQFPLGQYRFETIDQPVTEVVAPAGTLLVCDTRCIHGGVPIREGHRYAVTLYTFRESNDVESMFAKSGLDPAIVSQAGSSIEARSISRTL
ncbi:MAG: phytanoyl-CoA dioxygenase family protein [Pseudomonadota bacterium]